MERKPDLVDLLEQLRAPELGIGGPYPHGESKREQDTQTVSKPVERETQNMHLSLTDQHDHLAHGDPIQTNKGLNLSRHDVRLLKPVRSLGVYA